MAIATTTAIALGLMAASTAVTLYATDTQAKQGEANLKFQAKQAEADANAERGAAQVEADRIRKAAKAQRATATAQAAAAGIDVNSPTAVKIDEEIVSNSEEDAFMTLLNGSDRGARLNQQASADRIGAGVVRSNGKMQQGATLLSAAGSMSTGWKRAPNGQATWSGGG